MKSLYTRDLDGTGSQHPCAPDDPGAVQWVDPEEARAAAIDEAIQTASRYNVNRGAGSATARAIVSALQSLKGNP